MILDEHPVRMFTSVGPQVPVANCVSSSRVVHVKPLTGAGAWRRQEPELLGPSEQRLSCPVKKCPPVSCSIMAGDASVN